MKASELDNLKLSELKRFVYNFYNKNLKGITVTNKQKGIKIKLSSKGIRHLIYARNVGYVKLKAILILRELIEKAKYSNFKNPDTDDYKEVLGYLNFTSKAIIENKIQNFHITVRVTNEGKFYFDHSVKPKK